jgi:hypothetical protein
MLPSSPPTDGFAVANIAASAAFPFPNSPFFLQSLPVILPSSFLNSSFFLPTFLYFCYFPRFMQKLDDQTEEYCTKQ